jgi:hypothetical protein
MGPGLRRDGNGYFAHPNLDLFTLSGAENDESGWFEENRSG